MITLSKDVVVVICKAGDTEGDLPPVGLAQRQVVKKKDEPYPSIKHNIG